MLNFAKFASATSAFNTMEIVGMNFNFMKFRFLPPLAMASMSVLDVVHFGSSFSLRTLARVRSAVSPRGTGWLGSSMPPIVYYGLLVESSIRFRL